MKKNIAFANAVRFFLLGALCGAALGYLLWYDESDARQLAKNYSIKAQTHHSLNAP